MLSRSVIYFLNCEKRTVQSIWKVDRCGCCDTDRCRMFNAKVHRRLAVTRSQRECVEWRHHVTLRTSCCQDVMTSLSYKWRQQDDVLSHLTTINNSVMFIINIVISSRSRLAHSTSVTTVSYWRTSTVTFSPTSMSTLRALLVDQAVSTRTATAPLFRLSIPVVRRIPN